jgi:hypothetical protein
MQMEGVFGWVRSSICEWWEKMIYNIPVAMRRYNKGF